jgi:hypothetical protein
MKKTVLFLMLGALLLFQGSSTAMINGDAERARFFPYVGTLILNLFAPDGELVAGCTAVLVSDRVVLTAGHCLDPTWLFNPRFTLESPVSHDSVAYPGTAFTHPILDFGVLVLTRPVDLRGRYGKLPGLGQVARLYADGAGPRLTLVGYGLSDPNDPCPAVECESQGTRKVGTGTFSALDAVSLTLSTPETPPCYGDSGSPAFVAHSRVMAGLLLDADCQSWASYIRLDLPEVQKFIKQSQASAPHHGGHNASSLENWRREIWRHVR